MIAMVVMAFFVEVPKWHWYYIPALESLYLIVTSHIRLYIFFQCPFAVSVLSPFFDPEAPFEGIPLYMAHSAAASPQPTPLAAMEVDPSETSASSPSSSASGGSGHSPSDPRLSGIMVNGFLSPSPRRIRGIMKDLLGDCLVSVGLDDASCTKWPSFEYLFMQPWATD